MMKLSRSMLMMMLCAALAALCVLYLDTARSIVAIWNSSETFAHGYVILPISLWLIWKRRADLQSAAPAPFWAALALLAACGAGWLLAQLADVQVVRQYTFVAMLPIAVLAICGTRMAAAILFPLVFLMLAVPFGEIFIAPLINVTADFTVWALQATGIPVLRDGANFSIPSGNWSVVEACSGVRYLIASFTLGCLYAYLTYRSTGRRILFVLLSIVVPIIANGARAYMIVMLGHLSGMKLAVGVDHLLYGWIFFALVIFLMFWIGSYWREDEVAPASAARPLSPVSQPGAGRFAAVTLGVLICAGMWPAVAKHLEHAAPGKPAVDLSGFQPAWAAVAPFAQWLPHFAKANAELTRTLANGSDQAAITMLYFRDRPQGAGLINSENRLLKAKDPQWTAGPTAKRTVNIGPRTMVVRETPLRSGAGSILVWQWYWINDEFLENDYLGKLLQARGKLLERSDDGAALFAFAPLGEHSDDARAVLQRFLNDNLAGIEATLTRNQRQAGR
jgi:exosortase A